MNTSANLKLPYLLASQAQKHVIHNEALRMLDALVQLAVVSRAHSAPPPAPSDGERHIVATGATGAWSGKSGQVAAFQDGAWAFYIPLEGWLAWVADEDLPVIFDGVSWVQLPVPDSLPKFGVNTAADATNRLAIKSNAVLISHDDVTPGTGNIQLKLNKGSAAGSASLLYQTGWSGRAEFGVVGDDDFRIKVSPDGASWHDALVIDRSNGSVRLPATVPLSAPFNLFKDGGRFAGSPEPRTVTATTFTAPPYIVAANGATISQGPKFVHNNTDYGGSAGALHADIKALIDKLRDASYRRYGVEFYTLQITAGMGTSTARTIGGVSHYLPFGMPLAPLPAQWTFSCHILVRSGSVGLSAPTAGASQLFVDGTESMTALQILPVDGWRQVTRLYNRNPREFEGYDNLLHAMFTTPGTDFLIAAPVLTPGAITVAPNLYYGVVPGLEAWR